MNAEQRFTEIVEALAVFDSKLDQFHQKIEAIYKEVKQPAKEEGDWVDLAAWLKDIPGAPKLRTRGSVNQKCGRGNLFQPGRHYRKVNGRRVFIRSKVIEAVQQNLAQ